MKKTNDDKSFQSFDDFCGSINEDEKGMIGTLIDKTKSFVPRAIRFRRANAVMKKYLRDFQLKSLNLSDKFETSMEDLAKTIDKNYKKFKRSKIDPMMAMDRIDQAVNMTMSFRKDVETLKDDEIKKLHSSVDKILDSYTSAIDKRLDSPGFILNVELSERGKGMLHAKWVELSAIAKMEVEEKLMKILDNAGLGRIEEIDSELDAFVEEYKYSYGKDAIDFYISSIEEISPKQFKVEIFLRSPGHRYSLSEKGLLVSDRPELLSDPRTSKLIKMKNLHFATYTMTINADPSDYIRPYLKLTKVVKPRYGDIEQISDFISVLGSQRGQGNAQAQHGGNIPQWKPEPLDD